MTISNYAIVVNEGDAFRDAILYEVRGDIQRKLGAIWRLDTKVWSERRADTLELFVCASVLAHDTGHITRATVAVPRTSTQAGVDALNGLVDMVVADVRASLVPA